MATLTLNGSTSGNVVVTVPAISGTGNTITIPATTGTVLVNNSSSQTLFPDGTVSAPSISNDGDPNTGIYFPAADNVAIATGGVAALTADSSQNVSVTNTLVMGSSFKRNRIINGDMRVDQRNAGASKSCPASSITYVLDRWFLYPSGATLTAQQVSGTNTGTINAFRITGATGSTACNFEQRIENLNIQDLASKTITAKVKVYCSSSISNVTLYALSPTSANNYAAITTSFSTSITLNSGLNTITVTGTLDANAIYGQAIGIGFNSGIGNGVTVDISEFQVEQGSIATPYERQIYSDQLAQCQRYFQLMATASGIDFQEIVTRSAPTSSECDWHLAVSMRITNPTIYGSATYGRIVFYDTSFNLTTSNVTAMSIAASPCDSIARVVFSHGSVAGTYVYASFDTISGSGLLGLSAEL